MEPWTDSHRSASWRGIARQLTAGLLFLYVGQASAAADLPDDLTDMSLEALMDIEVTSVSKKPQKKSEAAAAVFVITADDLRNWGVTSIPDALRRVPGLEVARIDANKWAITARGFNSRFANKLLVLIDGRTVYTPLFTGVYWDANQVMLEDVERIEVIRGPGGTLWGANAVNGVINVITRSAEKTQGTLATAGAGNELERMVNIRHGGQTAGGRHYRIYAMSHSTDTGHSAALAHDDFEIAQGGFRSDWATGKDRHTLQGDYYEGTGGQELMIVPSLPGTIIDDADIRGGNLLYRLTRDTGNGADISLQAYFDYVGRESAVLFEDRRTLDIEFQHHFTWNHGHDVVWGLNYRSIDDDTDPTQIFSLTPSRLRVDLYTAFLQDEISLFDDRAKLTIGSKFEHNDFTGFEAQPNVRLAWQADDNSTLWGAVSRAVRTPARGEHDVSLATIPPPPAIPPLTIFGNDSFKSETLVAYELGFRRLLADNATLDVAAFYNDYNDLRTIDVYSAAPLEATFNNNMKGHTRGIEVDAHWQPRTWLSVNANYSWLKIRLDRTNGSADVPSESVEDSSPEHQLNFWMSADLDNRRQASAYLRYVDSLQNFGFPETGSYLELDARFGWTPRKNVEVAIVGQNLLDSQHPEFNPDFIFSLPTESERSVYVTVRVQTP